MQEMKRQTADNDRMPRLNQEKDILRQPETTFSAEQLSFSFERRPSSRKWGQVLNSEFTACPG